MEQAQEIIKGIQNGLLQWCDWKPDSRVLYCGAEEDALAEMLKGRTGELVCVSCETLCEEGWQNAHSETFDYVVSVEVLERQPDPGQILVFFRKLLKADGKLFLGMNNRLGLRYFCGDERDALGGWLGSMPLLFCSFRFRESGFDLCGGLSAE